MTSLSCATGDVASLVSGVRVAGIANCAAAVRAGVEVGASLGALDDDAVELLPEHPAANVAAATATAAAARACLVHRLRVVLRVGLIRAVCEALARLSTVVVNLLARSS
jgi:hypothetical protein